MKEGALLTDIYMNKYLWNINSLKGDDMETIREKFVSDIKEIILPTAGISIGVVNPVAGAAISIVAEGAKKVDEYRITHLIESLGKGLNEETLRNMLISYVRDNENRAMYVIDTFRKALLQDSLIAISLMGFILAENMNSDKEPSYIQQLIYRALVNATDEDLKIFRDLYIKSVVKNENNLSASEIRTCRWCVQSRLFDEHIIEFNAEERYTNTEVSDCLYKYTNKIPSYLWNS